MSKILRNPTKAQLKKIEELISQGVRQAAVANHFGLSARTFIKRKQEYPLISDAVDRGKASGEELVVGMLWNIIKDPTHKSHTNAVIFYLKTQCGWSETTVIEEKEKPGKGTTKLITKEDIK